MILIIEVQSKVVKLKQDIIFTIFLVQSYTFPLRSAAIQLLVVTK